MKYPLYIIIILFFIAEKIQSQSISPELLSNAVGEASNTNIKLSWSLGEIMVSDKSSGFVRITEGFYQTSLKVTAVAESNPLLEMKFKVYPNPTSDYLYISHNQSINESWLLMIYDIGGRLIYKDSFFQKKILDFNDMSKGLYMIKISDTNSSSQINYKIEKL